jgi:hypothetical protein
MLCLHASLVFGQTSSCPCPCGPTLCCMTDQICFTELYGPLSCGYSTSPKPTPSTVTRTIVTTITITSYQCPSCSTRTIDYTTGGSYGESVSYIVTSGVNTWVNDLASTTYTDISSYTSTISTVTTYLTYAETLSYLVSTEVATWVNDYPTTTYTELSSYTSTYSTITNYPPQVYTVTVYLTQTTYHTTVVSTYGSTTYTSNSTTYTSYATTPQLEVSNTPSPGNCAASLYMCAMSDGGGCCSSGYTCGGGSCTTSAAGAGQYVIAQQPPEGSGAGVRFAVSRTALLVVSVVAVILLLWI